MPVLLASLLALAFPALVLFAAAKDATSFTIPNWISLALVALFPAAAFAAHMPLATAGWHLAAGAGVLVAGMVMFALRWLGGGDAKLFAATALWLGLAQLPLFLLTAAVVGGFLAILLVMLRSALLRALVLSGPRWVTRLAEPGEGVPYGVAIAAGALMAFPQTPFAAQLSLAGLGL